MDLIVHRPPSQVIKGRVIQYRRLSLGRLLLFARLADAVRYQDPSHARRPGKFSQTVLIAPSQVCHCNAL